MDQKCEGQFSILLSHNDDEETLILVLNPSDVEDTSPPVTFDTPPTISLHTVEGLSFLETIRLQGIKGHKEVYILVDGGSIQNFA